MLRKITLALAFGFSSILCAQKAVRPANHVAASSTAAEAAFLKARGAGAPALRAFLERMPKGADLHMHLSGAVYAETFLKDAAQDKLCIDPLSHNLIRHVGNDSDPPLCPDGSLPALTAFRDQKLYDTMVDSFSMRSFVPSQGISGHDQFFATFGRFGEIKASHAGEWLDEVATRAALQNEQYLEVMITPSFTKAIALGKQFGWPAPSDLSSLSDSSALTGPDGASRAELSTLRDKLLAGGLRDEVAADRAELDGDLAARKAIEHCGGPSAPPACSVEIRLLYQVLRAFPPQQVFAQTLLAFEVASSDPNVVGLNFVQPEDAYLAMSEYHRQMRMLDYLHSVYPNVHISLHAGELTAGLVPPAGLRFHIREAVDLGHAERIGHGVDVMEETEPRLLLHELAERHVLIELNLTSNQVILGVTAAQHPLPEYLAARVPVALSTDDEGVSRIDLTNEYTRAALDFHLDYASLKQMARNSLEHSFLPGASLWRKRDEYSSAVPACVADPLGARPAGALCQAYLNGSPRAAQQWELEHRFQIFEDHFKR